MLSSDEIVRLLLDRGIPVSGSAISEVLDSAGNTRAFIFIPVHRDSHNRQIPSNLSLAKAREELAAAGSQLEFILTDGDNRDAEAGLRATLLHSFGHNIRNVFLSTEKQRATVWLDLKAGLESPTLDAISIKAQIFLNDVGIALGQVATTAAENVPTNTALLRVIRRLAPVDKVVLSDELSKTGLTIPSDDWLSRRLDLLRKHGGLVRTHDGRYALSYSTLKQLGSAKNASSPDIKRLLTLATAGK